MFTNHSKNKNIVFDYNNNDIYSINLQLKFQKQNWLFRKRQQKRKKNNSKIKKLKSKMKPHIIFLKILKNKKLCDYTKHCYPTK